MGNARKVINNPFPGVRFKCGAYRYRVPRWVSDDLREALFNGRGEITLARDIYEAQIKYFEIIHRLRGDNQVRIMDDLFDRYIAEVIAVSNTENTKRIKTLALEKLRPIFGGFPIGRVSTKLIMKYRDKRKDVPARCNQELETLSHIFTMAIVWGYLENRDHPMRELPWRWPKKAKSRIMEDDSYTIFRKHANPVLAAVTALGFATGLRKQDILNARNDWATADGILVPYMIKTRNSVKNQRPILYLWNDERRAAWDQAIKSCDMIYNDFVFVTSRGTPYLKNDKTEAYDTAYGKLIRKLEKEYPDFQRFSPHDVRRRVGSDAASDEEAAAALGHSSTAVTRAHYRVKPVIVK